jgi:hypothetical protein
VKTSVVIVAGVVTILAITQGGCDRSSAKAVSPTAERPPAAATPGGTLPQRSHADEPLLVVIEPQRPTAETDLTAMANDTSVTYAWSVNGSPVAEAVGSVLPKAMFRRSDTVAVEVSLGHQLARADVTIQNSAPRALEVSLGRPLDSLHQGLDLTAVPKGEDADGDEIRWEYQWIRNDEALSTETTSILPGDRYQRGDRITVMVTPSDGETRGEPYTPGAVMIANGGPEFVSRPPAHAGGAEYVYQVQAVDPETDPVRYRLVKAPAGMTMDAETGAIRWPLRGAAAGTHQIEIEVDDGRGGTASQPYELHISYAEGS